MRVKGVAQEVPKKKSRVFFQVKGAMGAGRDGAWRAWREEEREEAWMKRTKFLPERGPRA